MLILQIILIFLGIVGNRFHKKPIREVNNLDELETLMDYEHSRKELKESLSL